MTITIFFRRIFYVPILHKTACQKNGRSLHFKLEISSKMYTWQLYNPFDIGWYGNYRSLTLTFKVVLAILTQNSTASCPRDTLTLSQCTLAGPVYTGMPLECHATGWPSVHWDTTGLPSEYLQGTLEQHWENIVETAQTGMALGKL